MPVLTPPWTEGPLIGFDLETTSPDPETAAPVQWSMVTFHQNPDAMMVSIAEGGLVNPGQLIDAGATAVHGLTDALVADAEILDDAMGKIVSGLMAASIQNTPIVGMNIAFDLTVVDRTWRRITGQGLGTPSPCLDVFVLDKAVDKYRKGNRTLTALCEHYGVEFFGAHDAEQDVRATVMCLLALAKKHPQIGRMSLTDLHRAQIRWRSEQQQGLNRYFTTHGQDPIPKHQWAWPIHDASPLAPPVPAPPFVQGTMPTLTVDDALAAVAAAELRKAGAYKGSASDAVTDVRPIVMAVLEELVKRRKVSEG